MRRIRSVLLVLLASTAGGCDPGSDQETRAGGEADRAILTPAWPIPPGTAPRGTAEYFAAVAPPGPPPSRAALARGRESYGIFCLPCHGAGGEGDGPVTLAGFPPPPSFDDERLARLEPAAIVAVIGEGKGRMLPMAERIPPDERWAIAHFVKALQLAPEAGARRSGPGMP